MKTAPHSLGHEPKRALRNKSTGIASPPVSDKNFTVEGFRSTAHPFDAAHPDCFPHGSGEKLPALKSL